MSGGELDDSKDDISSMKKQMTDLKKMMGVEYDYRCSRQGG